MTAVKIRDGIDKALVKIIVLISVFKAECAQATISSMVVTSTNTTDDAAQNEGTSKYSKPGTFHKRYCQLKYIQKV